MQSIYLQCAAAAIRSAHNTIDSWKYWYEFLKEKVLSSLYVTLNYDNKDFFSPSFWDSPPCCVNLHFSSKGSVFHCHRNVFTYVKNTLTLFHKGDDVITSTNLQKNIFKVLKPVCFLGIYMSHLATKRNLAIFIYPLFRLRTLFLL